MKQISKLCLGLVIALASFLPLEGTAQSHPKEVLVVVIRTTPELQDGHINAWTDVFKTQGFYTNSVGTMAFIDNYVAFLNVVVPVSQKDAFLTTYAEDKRLAGVFSNSTFNSFMNSTLTDDLPTDFDSASWDKLTEILTGTSCENLIEEN